MSDQRARAYLNGGLVLHASGPPPVIRLHERNRLLAALPAEDYASLLPDLRPVQLKTRQRLALPDQPLDCVYFPRDSAVSMLVLMHDGKAVESAAVGNEGMLVSRSSWATAWLETRSSSRSAAKPWLCQPPSSVVQSGAAAAPGAMYAAAMTALP